MPEDSKQPIFRSQDVPRVPGVYVYRNSGGEVIYVGKARNLRSRMCSYFQPSGAMQSDPRRRALIHSIASYEIFPVETEQEALLLEDRFIKQYNPRYNVDLRDDKRYLHVCIDPTETFPRLQTARLRREDGRVYFGPFPWATALRTTIRFLEVRYGLRSCPVAEPSPDTKLHCHEDVIRDCLCPCVGKVTKEAYQERLEKVMAILRGDCRELVEELTADMQEKASKMDFEGAATIRDMIANLKSVLEPNRRFINHTLSTRLAVSNMAAVEALQKALNMEKPPLVMECFDMSNISGVLAVGSMVCFKDGRPSNKDYRRFRIRSETANDDTAFMREVLTRRYGRLLKENLPLPDLIILDGGAGQLRVGMEVFREIGMPNIVLIGLAKRHEHIIWPNSDVEQELPRENPGLRLLQAIRDEAHRFANGYHRLLRSKRIADSLLSDIPGIGKNRCKQLLTQFGSVKAIAKLTPEELAKQADGVGIETAKKIIDYLSSHLG